MKLKIRTIFILSAFIANTVFAQSSLMPITGFGSNPGNLNMYMYEPNGVNLGAPMVFALHGCSQTADIYAAQSGWNKLADAYGFYVVYPEQIFANNNSLCFNWFDTTDVNKNQGEALSIKQMVDFMVTNFDIDSTKIFITGLSAGAAMTVVMCADYPQIFNKGAAMAGIPYKAATSSFTSFSAMNGSIVKTPSQWGNLVRNQNPGYTGAYPNMAIFHGTFDFTVNSANATELIKQWTNLNNADQTIDSTLNSFNGNTSVVKTSYTDNLNNPVVEYYKINGMGHAIAVDTGSCPRQGGATGTYAILENNFHSSYWAANFFKINKSGYTISGSTSVLPNATNEIYTVPFFCHISTYNWTVPIGATIDTGQGSGSIRVNFGTNSGYIRVVDETLTHCLNNETELYITVDAATSVKSINKSAPGIYFNNYDNSILTDGIDLKEIKLLKIHNMDGQEINPNFSIRGNKLFFSNRFKKGLYIISFSDSKKQYAVKIVVY